MRVVWILFDELSYNQAFEHRQPGIDMPAFTKLASESVTFSQIAPVGSETEQVIPSLLLGQPVADVKGDADGRMLLRHDPNAPWQHFDQNATVFAAANVKGGAQVSWAGTTRIAAFSMKYWTAAIGRTLRHS